MSSPTLIAGYLALFTLVGFLFIFVNLLIGSLVRPKAPNVEKLEVYECGEPTIGSSFVQFDLRFYVVALLFIIFDVEVSFFFPWAVVFGKATHLADPRLASVAASADATTSGLLATHVDRLHAELGVPASALPRLTGELVEPLQQIQADARFLALTSIGDILAFFAILMVGFAYVWWRGDLDWVRALSLERARASDRPPLDFTDADLEPTVAA